MYYYNYNPFYMRNRNYYYNRNMQNISENVESEKKDTESQQSDTISFQKFYNNNANPNCDNTINESEEKIHTNNSTKKRNNKFISFDRTQINLLGFTFEIDDLIIIGIIILLLLESDENYALIIILGLIYRDFFADPEEREELQLKDKEEIKRVEEEIRKQK